MVFPWQYRYQVTHIGGSLGFGLDSTGGGLPVHLRSRKQQIRVRRSV